jgi:hypothetical protein
MALHLPRILRKDRTGGSLTLGELIEEYGEEIYLDLKEYWNFDLVGFIAGEVFSSIPIIFAMLRNLPEGARFTAAAIIDKPEETTALLTPNPRMDAVMDHRTWTLDRRLKAMEINALHSIIAVSGQWGKKGPPTFPTIGPAEWQPETKPKALEEPKDNFDVLKRMGWPGG